MRKLHRYGAMLVVCFVTAVGPAAGAGNPFFPLDTGRSRTLEGPANTTATLEITGPSTLNGLPTVGMLVIEVASGNAAVLDRLGHRYPRLPGDREQLRARILCRTGRDIVLATGETVVLRIGEDPGTLFSARPTPHSTPSVDAGSC